MVGAAMTGLLAKLDPSMLENYTFIEGNADMAELKPLTIADIAEGKFLEDFIQELVFTEAMMVKFVQQWRDAADKAKGRVVATVWLEYDRDDPHRIKVSGKVTSVLPKRPGRTCVGQIDHGRYMVGCLPCGATDDGPEQGRLCTQDGRVVDPKTGEVKA